MRRHAVAVGLLLPIVALGSARVASHPSEDEAAIRQTLQYYLDGHATGDSTPMRKAFHPTAELNWIRDGQFHRRSVDDYIAGFTGRPAEDEAQRKRRVVSVDFDGTAATGRIELDYPGVLITDYMSLLKIDGDWKIVHKIFHIQPKQQP